MKVVRRPYMGLPADYVEKEGLPFTYAHYCPGCKTSHDYAVDAPFRNGAQWTFNGDAERPTFSPSMKIEWGMGGDRPNKVCHYFVTDGQIAYCPDSTHELSGQTVLLPDWAPPAGSSA